MEANNFYKWWQHTIKGNYITNSDFENVLDRFNKPDLKNSESA